MHKRGAGHILWEGHPDSILVFVVLSLHDFQKHYILCLVQIITKENKKMSEAVIYDKLRVHSADPPPSAGMRATALTTRIHVIANLVFQQTYQQR